MKINWASVLGLATTVGGLITSPIVANIIPPAWSTVIIATGTLIQAVTKAVHKGDTISVPKTEATTAQLANHS